MSNMLETARQLGFFKTLVAAVDAAGLDDAFEHKGPFTLFAPTDQAFAKFGSGGIELLQSDPQKLQALLAHHIIQGRSTSDDVVMHQKVTTAMGNNLPVHMESDGIHIGRARVVEADLSADNGIIHAIDTVLAASYL